MVYVVERFDRTPDGDKIHIEDLAQVSGQPPQLRDSGADYDSIGVLVHRLAGPDDFREYLRRLVAMVLMGNNDAHLKNWSLIYRDGRTPRLSPAYDLVCTTVHRNLSRSLTFPLGGESSPGAVEPDHIRVLADAAGFPPEIAADVVAETASVLVESWKDVRESDLFADLVEHIDRRLTRHPLTRAT